MHNVENEDSHKRRDSWKGRNELALTMGVAFYHRDSRVLAME